MRYEDFGVNPQTKDHIKSPLSHAESAFLAIIWVDHVGRENAISAGRLAETFRARLHLSETIDQVKRFVREMQNHLIIRHDLPVYSAAGNGGGYYIGEESDAGEFYETFRERGLTGLTKASRGRRSGMIDAVMQLSFRWRELVIKSGVAMPEGEDDDVNGPIQVVDAMLRELLKNPEKFGQGLRLLGEKYGSVLVPRAKYELIRESLRQQADRMNELVRGLE